MIPTSTPDSINGSKRVHHKYINISICNRKNTSIYNDLGNLKKRSILSEVDSQGFLKLGTLRPGAS